MTTKAELLELVETLTIERDTLRGALAGSEKEYDLAQATVSNLEYQLKAACDAGNILVAERENLRCRIADMQARNDTLQRMYEREVKNVADEIEKSENLYEIISRSRKSQRQLSECALKYLEQRNEARAWAKWLAGRMLDATNAVYAPDTYDNIGEMLVIGYDLRRPNK